MSPQSPLLTRRQVLTVLGALPLGAAGCRIESKTGSIVGSNEKGRFTANGKVMTSERSVFGTLPDGREAHLYVFRNANGTTLKFTNYGLIVTELHARDRAGQLGNVVLGFETLQRYLQGHPFFGVVAGRYANRIALGKFNLDGKEYSLAVNNGANHLHGGLLGFDKRLWTASEVQISAAGISLDLSYLSPDGEEGYPGTLAVTVTYTLTHDDTWRIEYRAVTDAPTILNLTNHSYFNLLGRGDVLQHELQIEADTVTAVDDGLIPTGQFLPVKGTGLDFTHLRAIGSHGMRGGLKSPGYDHNFVLRHGGGTMGRAARVVERGSGRTMECHTRQPGVQLWTFNSDPNPELICTGGVQVPRHGGFCLETQHYPDSIHHPHFPTCVLRPGETFSNQTEYRFGTL